jgi:hypothetical protein
MRFDVNRAMLAASPKTVEPPSRAVEKDLTVGGSLVGKPHYPQGETR